MPTSEMTPIDETYAVGYLQTALQEETLEAPDTSKLEQLSTVFIEIHRIHQNKGGSEAVRKTWDILINLYPGLADLLQKIQSPSTDEQVEYPALPEGAQPDFALGQGAGKWIDTYLSYAKQVSPMTPDLFHEAAALWLASVAIARRLKVCMSFGTAYPNLFVQWIAPTTLWRKTTGLSIARDLAQRTFPHLMAPQDTTPEAMLADMSGREPSNLSELEATKRADRWRQERNFAAQRGWLLDESSSLLANAGKDYNAGLIEAILQLYDCTSEYTRSTRSQGRIIVPNTYLSLLGNSTPAALAEHLKNERLWSMGWWPRFALLTPETKFPAWKASKVKPTEPTELLGTLQKLYENLPQVQWPTPPEAKEVSLGTGVLDTWERYNKALSYDLLISNQFESERLYGLYGRLPMQALKIATILTALDWAASGKHLCIELPHIIRGIEIAEQWRASAHRAIHKATQTHYSQTAERILRQLAKDPINGVTMRDLTKGLRDMEPQTIEQTVSQLQSSGQINILEHQNPKGGRPTSRYTLNKN